MHWKGDFDADSTKPPRFPGQPVHRRRRQPARCPGSLAAEAPLETTSVRLTTAAGICIAPQYLAGELLRADGFTDVSFVPAMKGPPGATMIGRGEADFTSTFAGSVILPIDEGAQITALAGVHRGCYELFAHEGVGSIMDLKGKRISVPALRSSPHLFLSAMARHIGLDPRQDIEWVVPPPGGSALEAFAEGKTDAFLGFPPEPQELRARGVGRVLQHRNRAAVVAILLLHAARQPG